MGFGQGLGCSGTCAKLILFVVNIAIFLCGAALLGVGLGILLGADAFDWFEDISGDASMGDPLLLVALYTMITVGCLLFLVGFFGCCGACKESKCMLMTYALLVIILLVVQITGAILAIVYKEQFGAGVEESMTTSVQRDYGVIDNTATTKAWDEMQIEWECCGSEDFKDYENSTYADTTGNIIPQSCCTMARIVDDDVVSIDPMDFTACKEAAIGGSGGLYHTTGCYEEVQSWVDEYSAIIIGVLFGLAFVQFVSSLLACALMSSIDENSYSV